MKVNKDGFSAFEILVVIVLYASVFSIIAIVALNSANKTKFKTLKYDAIAFSYNVKTYLTYNDLNLNGKVYLKDLVNYDDSYNITSPFDANNKCDLNNSYVKINQDKTYVTLECDNYSIYEYDTSGKECNIYSVGQWLEDKPVTSRNVEIDQLVLYNYKKNNRYMLNEFVSLDLFIEYYNINEGTQAKNLNQVPTYEKKTYYRVRKVVSSFEN